MKIHQSGSAVLGVFVFATLCGVAAHSGALETKPARSGDSQIHFEKTSGADASPIRYVARSRAYDIYISREEADVVLHGGLEPPSEAARGEVIVVRTRASILRMRFVNSDLPTSVEPFAQPRGANSFDAVAYRGIYPGTDIIVRAAERRLGFQLNLSPGADARNIVLELDGATSIALDSRGNAVVHAGRETIVLQRPTAKIQSSTAGRMVVGAYLIESETKLRFIANGNLPKPSETITD